MAVALLLAAGSGERLGAGRPKGLVELAGKPLLAWSLEALRASPDIERIAIAMPADGEAGFSQWRDHAPLAGSGTRSVSRFGGHEGRSVSAARA